MRRRGAGVPEHGRRSLGSGGGEKRLADLAGAEAAEAGDRGAAGPRVTGARRSSRGDARGFLQEPVCKQRCVGRVSDPTDASFLIARCQRGV